MTTADMSTVTVVATLRASGWRVDRISPATWLNEMLDGRTP